MKIFENLKAKANEALEKNIEKGTQYISLLIELHQGKYDPLSDFSNYRYELDEKEAACLAAHVYGTYHDTLLLNGWKRTKAFDNLIAFSSEELKASLYVKEVHREKLYAYCFAGTELTSGHDWANNIYQTMGLSFDYAKAVKNAKLLSEGLQGAKLFFVGHSKGGGQAMLCSMVTGRPSIVFNPAPVSNLSKILNNINSTKIAPIDVYVAKNDPLYNSEDMLQKLGDKGTILSRTIGMKVDGEIHELDMTGITDLYKEHSIDSFLQYYNIISSVNLKRSSC